ncbi:flagellar protein FlbD [Sediminibacillus dalangtanensis]|uniref:Flagellar protein FlbD n=1 Tax=Sediminibacillus dalangtanensis TaxID=2729421 RepID=A0ABX7VRD1_9BACI|nr:flagellar FlbD family protein [Sediminibacillus dalangtanensis]QTM99419.1 flagellar protein FlbD [Sediminibacillus dalangtanensis]
MIKLTRLNGDTFSLNAVYVEQIQSFPDTTISLVTGKKLVVRETENEVNMLIQKYYQTIGLQGCVKEAGDVHGQ